MTTGTIIPIGGAEEKTRAPAILEHFVALCGGHRARIAIIPTASSLPDTGTNYEDIFRELGVGAARSLPIQTRADCNDPRFVSRIEKAEGVFLTGGNQLKLSTTIGGTRIAELLRRRHAEDGLVIAGTSAGAAILSEHMIAFGEEGSTPHADMVTLAPGLGLCQDAIIDQHFRQRDRLGRLLTALAYNPRPIGIGLDEDTAAVIGPDRRLTVRGSGAITVVDPSELEYSSMDSAERKAPVSMLNVRLHILTEGDGYDIDARRPIPAQEVDEASPAADSQVHV